MTNKLRLTASIIETDKNDEEKKYFTNIGAAFAHPDGKGFDLDLKVVPLNGEFSLFLPNDSETSELDLSEHKYLEVYNVESKKKEDDSYDNFYHKMGSAFPHKNDKGINVVLTGLPVQKKGFKMVIRTPKEKEDV